MSQEIQFSVFTKAWGKKTIDELGQFVSDLGFDGIEFPLRPGYQVEPENAVKELPRMAKQLENYGLKIFSVASTLDEHIFAACAEAGVTLIRKLVKIEKDGFHPSVARARQQMERALPLCEKYGVKIGIQNHIGGSISNASGLLYFLEQYNPQHIAAIWDAAHNAMAGEEPEIALSTVWNNLAMINLKNAIHVRTNGPEADVAEWDSYFTTGRQGLASWKRVADYLRARNYQGVVCLTAEYQDRLNEDCYIEEDIRFAKRLFSTNV